MFVFVSSPPPYSMTAAPIIHFVFIKGRFSCMLTLCSYSSGAKPYSTIPFLDSQRLNFLRDAGSLLVQGNITIRESMPEGSSLRGHLRPRANILLAIFFGGGFCIVVVVVCVWKGGGGGSVIPVW
jgi:hypothetical protein